MLILAKAALVLHDDTQHHIIYTNCSRTGTHSETKLPRIKASMNSDLVDTFVIQNKHIYRIYPWATFCLSSFQYSLEVEGQYSACPIQSGVDLVLILTHSYQTTGIWDGKNKVNSLRCISGATQPIPETLIHDMGFVYYYCKKQHLFPNYRQYPTQCRDC